MKKKELLIVIVSLVVVVVGYLGVQMFTSSDDAFPNHTISVNAHAGAGGGTDVWVRKMCSILEQDLGQSLNVSNVTGGSGGECVNLVSESASDGYTWLGFSESLATHVANGIHTHTTSEFDYYIIGGCPGVLCVAADSPYTTYDEFIEAAKENPGELKVSNSGRGKLWHLKTYIAAGLGEVPLEYVPYGGSGDSIIACLNGEVTAVAASIGEINDYVKAGQLRPLVALETDSYVVGEYTVPSACDYFEVANDYYPLAQVLGIAVKTDTPQEVKDVIEAAFNTAMASDDMKEFAEEQFGDLYGYTGAEAKEYMVSLESKMSSLLVDLGLNQVDIEEFGIEYIG